MTFALELYRALARTPGNLFCSPYSVEAALAMVTAGSAGHTRDQLAAVLGDDPVVVRHEARPRSLANQPARSPVAVAMARYLPRPQPGATLAMANAMWHQRGYRIHESFVVAIRDRLAAEVRDVDFAGDPAGAVKVINAWAARATRDKIVNVLAEVAPETRVILANAIYFKAMWDRPFEPHNTRQRGFTTGAGQNVRVPTMSHTGSFRYAALSAIEAIELPYRGNQTAMLVVVPPLDQLTSLERVLDFDRIASALTTSLVEVQLPRFSIESAFGLRDALEGLGLADLFSGRGDFSSMTTEPGFAIDEVVHKTYVDVDEEGTEAAAVTGAMMRGATMRQRPEPIKLHIDRPFIFAIRDIATHTNLFIGRVEDPR